MCKFKKEGEHRSERNDITSSQLTYTGELIKINTAYCDKFLRNAPRNIAVTYTEIAVTYTEKIILVFQSRINSKTAQQNTVKVPAAQFRIAYCPNKNVLY